MEVQAADPNRMTESLSCLTEMCGIGGDKEAVIPYTIKTEGQEKVKNGKSSICMLYREGRSSAESPPKERICEVRPGAGSVKRE